MSEKDISDEQLLEDIRLTTIELATYRELQNGYRILASMPENIENKKSRLYQADHEYFLQLCNECNDFLLKLNKIKSDRGL